MRRRGLSVLAFAMALMLLTTAAPAQEATPQRQEAMPQTQTESDWYQQAEEEVAELGRRGRRPRNVILFVGDGMGVSTVTAARILEGQLDGDPGEENELSFETFPYSAMSKVYNTNAQVPDSAGTMTAMMTGVKTDIGVLNLDESVERGVCGSGDELTPWLKLAEDRGLATGVVSTARLTHATPAATYSYSVDRNWEADGDVPDDCDQPDIASQLIDFDHGDGIEVAMGGGRRAFLPEGTETAEGTDGVRQDGRNLATEWVDQYPNSAYVEAASQLDDVSLDNTDHLLGLFESSHLEYEHDRPDDDEPSLEEMTTTAIEILDENRSGYALMVEAGRIDHAHHATNAYRALTDTIELSEAVEAAVERVNLRDTMIVVTADHSHVFTINGYPPRGNDILGVAGQDAHGDDYTTLGYHNGSSVGFTHDHNEDGAYDADDSPFYADGLFGRMPVSDPTHPDYQQHTLIELGSETHSGEDVTIYADGPRADVFRGVQEQNVIGVAIIDALRLDR